MKGLRSGGTLLLVQLLACSEGSAAGVGLCLDQRPAGLAETGYTAASALTTRAQCVSAGHEWCPLSNETKTFGYTDTASGATAQIEYYWWSACCTGKQGQSLIADSIGLPTCESGTPALECRRRTWQQKLEADLLGGSYNFQVAPGQVAVGSDEYGGVPDELVGCKCKSTDPNCEMPGAGADCLVCRTDEPCSQKSNQVQISVSFFKITSVDLRSSELEFSAWIRQIWCALSVVGPQLFRARSRCRY
jgi:hypothetical protein